MGSHLRAWGDWARFRAKRVGVGSPGDSFITVRGSNIRHILSFGDGEAIATTER